MRPIVIGVASGTGSGKTTVVRKIVDSLGDDAVSFIQHDFYYKDHPELSLEDRGALNYDHPDALETSLLVEHLARLRDGHAVEVPGYDFSLHARQREGTQGVRWDVTSMANREESIPEKERLV